MFRRWTVFAAVAAILGSLAGGPATAARNDRATPPSLAVSAAPSDSLPYRHSSFSYRSMSWDELSFTDSAPLPLPPQGDVDADGIPLTRWHGTLVYNPTKIAGTALVRLDTYHDSLQRGQPDQGQLDQAVKQANKLVSLAVVARGGWFLPHNYENPGQRQVAPWYNALSQGLALSLFVRLFQIQPEHTEYLDAARAIFRGFLATGQPKPWVAYVVSGYLWLEHYPIGRSIHVLNGHMFGLFGLYDYYMFTGDPDAKTMLDGAVTSMRDNLSRYRHAGHFSWYDFGHKGASMKYHSIHYWQVRYLGKITGDLFFKRFARSLLKDHSVSPHPWGQPFKP